MNEAEQREQQARSDAIDNLLRALFVVRAQCYSLEQFRKAVISTAWGVDQLYRRGERDPDQVLKAMAKMEQEDAAEEV